jgi:membrane-associated phospholipid phosphatase
MNVLSLSKRRFAGRLRDDAKDAATCNAAAKALGTRYALLALACLLLSAALLPFDVAIAKYCHDGGVSEYLVQLCELSEVFSHGAGASAIILTALVLDHGLLFRDALQLAIASLGSGLACNAGKLFVARARPREIVDWAAATGLDTFVGWTWTTEWSSRVQSFPSAHAATSVGLAAILSVYYPRGRTLFAVFATLACWQRIISLAHYPSDVLVGAGLGLAVVAWQLKSDRYLWVRLAS